MAKRHKEEKAAQEAARRAKVGNMLKDESVHNWSTMMPPYCYTVLCPDPDLRMHPASVDPQG